MTAKQHTGMQRFLDVIDGVPDYILIADSVTMSHPDLPVVFLSTADSGAEWAGRGDRVRVAARSVATVDAVLSIAEDMAIADAQRGSAARAARRSAAMSPASLTHHSIESHVRG